MKKLLTLLFLTLVMLSTAACTGPQNPAQDGADLSPIALAQGQVIGSVNDVEVYRYEYDFYLNMYYNEYFNNYYDSLRTYEGIDLLDEESSRELLGNLEDFAWQSVVQAALLRQMAQEHGISLEPAYYEDLLLPSSALALNTNRLYGELFPIMQEEAAQAKQVSDDEARASYESDPSAWDSRQVAHIIFTTQGLDEAGKAEAKAKAEDIIARLDAGEDFAELAQQYSEDGAAANGGVMDLYFNVNGGGVSEASSFDPTFAAGAFALANVGDHSAEPVESSFGYHIIKLLDKKEGFEATKEYVLANLQSVDSTAVSEFIQNQLTERQATANVVCNYEFKYFTEPTEEPTEEPAEPAEEPTEPAK